VWSHAIALTLLAVLCGAWGALLLSNDPNAGRDAGGCGACAARKECPGEGRTSETPQAKDACARPPGAASSTR